LEKEGFLPKEGDLPSVALAKEG